METKQAPQNIQDGFLNAARRDRGTVTIYLLHGAKLTGRIKSFDKFSLVLETGSQEQLIFKHAISTISHARRASGELLRPPQQQNHASGELRAPQSQANSSSPAESTVDSNNPSGS